MAKYCPYTDGEVVYLTCEECEEKICEGYLFCLVTRNVVFDDEDMLKKGLDTILGTKNVCIVTGGSNGAEAIAREYAIEHSLPYIEFPDALCWDDKDRMLQKFISKQRHRVCVICRNNHVSSYAYQLELANEYHNRPFVIYSRK